MKQYQIRYLGLLMLLLWGFSSCVTNPEVAADEPSSVESSEETDYKAVVDQILTDIHKIATHADQPMVKEAYYYVKEKMNNENFAFTINQRRSETIYGTASYGTYKQPKGNMEGVIEINVHLLDMYKEHPATIMSIVFHEFQHVRDHFSFDGMSENYNNDPLEQFLYEMDASFLQSLFLIEAAKTYPVDSLYMDYLISSVKQDDLQRLSVDFYGKNKEMVYPLYSMRRQVEEGQMSLDQYLTILANLGKNLEQADYSEDQIMGYFSAVFSYVEFAPSLINPLLTEDFDMTRADIQSIISSVDNCQLILLEESRPYTDKMEEIRAYYDING